MRVERWKRVLVLVFALQFGLLTALEGQSCKSGAQVVSNVWNEYDKVVKQVGCVVGAGTVTLATAGVGLPAGAAMYARCLADANTAQQVSEGLVGLWNQLAANKSLTWGPRHLELGKEHQGTLRGTGNRVFVSEPLRGDRLNLWIKKLRYRGPTDVTVCKFPPAGPGHGIEGEQIASAHFAKGNDNLSEVERLQVDGVAGHVVTVFLNMTQGWKAMQYRLRGDVERMIELEEAPAQAAADETDAGEASPADASRVVIAGPPSARGDHPGVVRLRNVGGDGFEVRFQEWDYRERDHGDTSHTDEGVPYIAMEPGRREAADGSVWEVGSFRLEGERDWSRQSFRSSFPERPKVFVTVQSANGGDAVAARLRNVDADGFEAALLEEEATDGDHTDEVVGYLAVHSASGEGEVSVHGFAVPYRLRTVEVDDGWTEVGAARLTVEEETSSDDETDHVAETVDVLELGGRVVAQIVSNEGPNTAALRQGAVLSEDGVGIQGTGRAVADEGWRTFSVLPF